MPKSVKNFDNNLKRAVSLAKWLIEKHGKRRKVAYIISSRKFGISDYNLVRKGYNVTLPKQIKLF